MRLKKDSWEERNCNKEDRCLFGGNNGWDHPCKKCLKTKNFNYFVDLQSEEIQEIREEIDESVAYVFYHAEMARIFDELGLPIEKDTDLYNKIWSELNNRLEDTTEEDILSVLDVVKEDDEELASMMKHIPVDVPVKDPIEDDPEEEVVFHSFFEDLENLRELHIRGIISDEEFDQKRYFVLKRFLVNHK